MLIGEKVAALMAEEGLNLEAIAARVRSAGAPNVRYQHIQQLIDVPTRKPRYLPELARAFGMTVDEFLQWRPGGVRESRNMDGYTPAPRGSQAVKLKPEILAASYRLVRLAHMALAWKFDAEETEDANLVLLAYNYLEAKQEPSVTTDNLVDFTAYLRKRQEAQQDGHESKHDGKSSAGRTRARTG